MPNGGTEAIKEMSNSWNEIFRGVVNTGINCSLTALYFSSKTLKSKQNNFYNVSLKLD